MEGYSRTSTVGHKSNDPCFHVFLMVAGVITFVTLCAVHGLTRSPYEESDHQQQASFSQRVLGRAHGPWGITWCLLSKAMCGGTLWLWCTAGIRWSRASVAAVKPDTPSSGGRATSDFQVLPLDGFAGMPHGRHSNVRPAAKYGSLMYSGPQKS